MLRRCAPSSGSRPCSTTSDRSRIPVGSPARSSASPSPRSDSGSCGCSPRTDPVGRWSSAATAASTSFRPPVRRPSSTSSTAPSSRRWSTPRSLGMARASGEDLRGGGRRGERGVGHAHLRRGARTLPRHRRVERRRRAGSWRGAPAISRKASPRPRRRSTRDTPPASSTSWSRCRTARPDHRVRPVGPVLRGRGRSRPARACRRTRCRGARRARATNAAIRSSAQRLVKLGTWPCAAIRTDVERVRSRAATAPHRGGVIGSNSPARTRAGTSLTTGWSSIAGRASTAHASQARLVSSASSSRA